MAAGDCQSGMTVALTFASGLCAKVTNVDFGSVERDAIECSNADSTLAKEFFPHPLYDPGEVSGSCILDTTSAWQSAIESAKETCTLTLPNNGSAAATYSADGFMTSYSFGIPYDDKMTVDFTIKLTGVITDTVAT